MNMRRLALALSLAVAVPPLVAGPAPSAADLRGITQELLDAIAPGNAAPWERALDQAFLHVDENGVVRHKQEFLAELQPLPPGLVGTIEIDRWEQSVHGETVVTAYEIQEHLDYHGQRLGSRFRSVDTWMASPAGWRMIAEHTAAVLKDPPAISLPPAELCAYAGSYDLTPDIRTTLRCEGGVLVSERTGRPAVRYSAELRDLFFAPGQPRTRRIFLRDAAGKLTAFVDRREGEDVRWTRREEPGPSEHKPAAQR